MQYGFLSEERRNELRSVNNAVSTDQRMCKLYAVLHLLGFENISGLSAGDQATLTLVEKYVKFKQGEVWMEMSTRFHVKGFRPTGPDRARLQSGIDFSDHLATIVAKDQRRLLQQQADREMAAERQMYAATLAQAKLEHDIKFYKKDKSQVTAKEKQEARLAREKMLEESKQATSRALAHANATWRADDGEETIAALPTAELPCAEAC